MTTRKGRTRKKATEGVVEEVIETKEVIKEEKVEEQPKSTPPKKRKDIDRNEMIACRSVVKGGLTYRSPKTGLTTRWENFGDIEFIEFGELITMKSANPKFLNEPYVIIEDEDVVEFLGLRQIYEKAIKPEEMESFFEGDIQDIKDDLVKLPRGSKQLVADKAREFIKEGKLNNIRVIRLLENELDIDLQDLIS